MGSLGSLVLYNNLHIRRKFEAKHGWLANFKFCYMSDVEALNKLLAAKEEKVITEEDMMPVARTN